MTTTTYTVEGLTCGFCMAEVMQRIHMLPGVTRVAVDLVPGGRSPLVVTSGSAMPVNEVYQAVENAGFEPALRDDSASAQLVKLGMLKPFRPSSTK